MRVTDKYVFFYRSKEIYSNWYMSKLVVNWTEYNCSEQYMMAEKARFFGDMETLDKIMKAVQPRDQKALGRTVKNFDAEQWNRVAKDRVYPGIRAKFEQNIMLRQSMLETGDRIFVEASPTDTIWGVGLAEEDDLILDSKNWRGTNWLGEVLTKVRDDIKKG